MHEPVPFLNEMYSEETCLWTTGERPEQKGKATRGGASDGGAGRRARGASKAHHYCHEIGVSHHGNLHRPGRFAGDNSSELPRRQDVGGGVYCGVSVPAHPAAVVACNGQWACRVDAEQGLRRSDARTRKTRNSRSLCAPKALASGNVLHSPFRLQLDPHPMSARLDDPRRGDGGRRRGHRHEGVTRQHDAHAHCA